MTETSTGKCAKDVIAFKTRRHDMPDPDSQTQGGSRENFYTIALGPWTTTQGQNTTPAFYSQSSVKWGALLRNIICLVEKIGIGIIRIVKNCSSGRGAARNSAQINPRLLKR